MASAESHPTQQRAYGLLWLVVALQLAIPASYYFRSERDDERFAWRMFSAVRVKRCEVELRARHGESWEEVDLDRLLHASWQTALERGRKRVKLATADAIADQMVGAILADSDAPPSGSALLVVNGFGGTPALELYLMYNAARRILEKRGLAVTRSLVGSYVTSLEMAGCSITTTLLDDKLTALWDDPVHTAALRW